MSVSEYFISVVELQIFLVIYSIVSHNDSEVISVGKSGRYVLPEFSRTLLAGGFESYAPVILWMKIVVSKGSLGIWQTFAQHNSIISDYFDLILRLSQLRILKCQIWNVGLQCVVPKFNMWILTFNKFSTTELYRALFLESDTDT